MPKSERGESIEIPYCLKLNFLAKVSIGRVISALFDTEAANEGQDS